MIGCLALAAAIALPQAFSYDRSAPLNVTTSATTIGFSGAHGRPVTGVLYRAHTPGRHAAILFVHWLGTPATTNHTEFDAEARALATRGADTLLIDAMWAKPHWFERGRAPETDVRDSIDQVIDLRRSLDVLESLPDVDPQRIAYVGHDFGAMYGAVLAGVDTRPKAYALISGTSSFAQWYLLGEKPHDEAAYRSAIDPFDPTQWLPKASARAFLFQFGTRDEYVSAAQSIAFESAAPAPRGVYWYDTGHEVAVPAARADRTRFLLDHLGLQ